MKQLTRGQKLRNTMIAKYGSETAWKEHLAEIGRLGGKNGLRTKRGFGSGELGKERARVMGKIGGRLSRRKSQ